MPVDLAIVVPTRGRPENIEKVISAWDFTNAWDVADLILAVDADDPEVGRYRHIVNRFMAEAPYGATTLTLVEMDEWMPMVHKLEAVVRGLVLSRRYFAVGFAGDDHLPRTINWAKTYLANLRALGSGMVYGDDGYQGQKLSSEWAMTTDVIEAWGRMVPAQVEHMYCDQALLEAMTEAGAARYLPQVQIEHMHPHAQKASNDEQYKRVNSPDQYAKDRKVYSRWADGERAEHVAAVRKLRTGRPSETNRPVSRRIQQRRKASAMSRRSPFPHFFRQVQQVTPDDIGLTLADLASQVPADQAIVELGVYHGGTTLRLAWGATQGHGAHVWGIDPWDSADNVYGETLGNLQSARRWARHWVTSLGYGGRITLLQSTSQQVAADWGPDQPKVGLLFVDGDHTAEGVRRDIESWAPHLAEGAVIALDDYVTNDYYGVRETVDELVNSGVLEPIELHHNRMAITRLAGKVGDEIPSQESRVVAITSEGVEVEHPGTALTTGTEPDEFDVALSAVPAEVGPVVMATDRERVTADEATTIQVSPGTEIGELTLPQLRALARARSITLGVRKDKKADTLQAIRDGR